jgi:3-oxoacyl-(acyl-carrier-protein) synthase
MEQALAMSGWKPQDVDYINLHGTGTLANDPLELKAVKEVFGEAAKNVAVSSTKDRHGHLIAAAGIMELCLLGISMENNLVPCTRNLSRPLIEEGMDLVRGENRIKKVNRALSNSFAFGGVNTVLAVQRI